MSGAVAVLRREIAERRLLFAGAAALGLLPLAAPFLPGGYQELRGDMAVFLAQILSVLLAVLLGATVVSRDLAEGRLSFYFSRPLSGGAVWAGKLGGAALLTGACGLLALLPGWLAAGWGSSKVDLDRLFSWGLVLLTLLFLAHAAGVLLRERSAWLLLDFAACCVVATLIDVVERNSYLSGTGVLEQVSRPGLAAAVAILAAASAMQLVAGRSDLRRGRRLLSLWLWPPLLAVAAALVVYSYSAIEARPRDLARAEAVEATNSGHWVAVSGPVKGLPDYHPGLLIDTRSGYSILLPELQTIGGGWNPLAFSADGRRAVFAEIRSQPYTLYHVELEVAGAEPTALTGVGHTGREHRPLLALSSNGRYLAQCAGGRLIVDDLTADRLVATVALPPYRSMEQIRFLDPGTLRFFSSHSREEEPAGGPHVRIQDLDLRTGEASPPVVLRDTRALGFVSSQDGRRLLLWSRGGALRLHDAASGERIADLDPGTRHRQAAFLADGRPLLALPHPRGTELRIFPPDASGEPRRHLLEGVRQLRFGGQPSPTSLVLATFREKASPFRSRSELLDLETGRRQALAEDLMPSFQWGDLPGPDSLASRLFLRDGTLVLLDLATGRERILTGEGALEP